MPADPVKSPFRGLRRLWHMMLGSRVVMIDGVRLHAGPGSVSRQMRNGLYKGNYEAGERTLLPRAVQPGDRVLEIGAGIGLISLLRRRLAGPGHVASYEANPRMAEVIRRNFALNGLEPDLTMKAVTEDGAPLRFFVDDNIISSSMIRRRDGVAEIEVPSEAIGTCIARHRPDVIVMDVEGAELGLLRRADLAGVKRILVEMHPHIVGKEAVAALARDVCAAGFELAERVGLNYLFVRSTGRSAKSCDPIDS